MKSDLPYNVIVAGLTRSGLTATCQMLSAGGMKVAGVYPDFEPYPLGYIPWGKVNGQVVKLVDSHRQFPPIGTYAVIRLCRDRKEQAKSFRKFVGAMLGVHVAHSDRLMRSFRRDYKAIDEWARKQDRFLRLRFEHIIEQPKRVAEDLAAFLNVSLDIEKAASAILPRRPECHRDLLEVAMLHRSEITRPLASNSPSLLGQQHG